MQNKLIRLGKAMRYETIKRLPWIVALLVLLGAFAAWQSYRKTAEGVEIARNNTTSLTRLGEDIKRLTEQNTELSKQNNRLAKENARHIDCIAKLFAEYIQTGQTIDGVDLDTCIILATTDSNSAIDGGRPSPSPQIDSSRSSSQNTSNGSGKKADNSHNDPDPPQPPDNEGVVIDLPLLPKIHIPSPL